MVTTAPRVRRGGAFVLVVLGACAALVLRTDESQARLTDYATDLQRLDAQLLALGPRLIAPSPLERATRQVALLQRRAALTGSTADEARARAAAAENLQGLGPAPDLLLLAADFALRFHRLAEARADLERLPARIAGPSAEALRSDLALQEGDYARARLHCEEALRVRRDWDVLERLAHLESLRGASESADALYAQAEDELTAKEMRAYAWVELQRGQLALSRGRHAEAEQHYARAERGYSGDWRVAEHLAELCAAERRFEEAVALYERVVARVARPEIEQALGDLLAFIGRPEAARGWHDRALRGYLASVGRGEVHYFHHLAGFFADARPDADEALRWARRDAALRGGVPTQDALAWALYRAGRFSEALDAMRTALQGGIRDAHLCFRAGMIHLAAGRAAEGRHWLALAADLNPHYDAFHEHR
ncbi:MAG TPA: hypothetical protein VN461_11550 [Vicinamibacteria bacterium]|jgi:tetratricopeptide (TPR) repeat protein|nr:hypothetical protein [Vicinamibacteria bacterium]